jgi:hypothetical protein
MSSAQSSLTEQEVFNELQVLCTSPGYVHALAHIGVRDNLIVYGGVMSPAVMAASYDRERTIRTEYTTLLGLMLKGPIDFALPAPDEQRSMVERTYALLEQLHECLRQPMFDAIIGGLKQREAGIEVNPDSIFARGDVLREPIFYGSESAYSFQYSEFALQRYAQDDSWLRANKGFGIADAHAVALAMSRLTSIKLGDLLPDKAARAKHDWAALPGYTLSAEEVSQASGVELVTTRAVLDAFTAPASPCNGGFASLGDFNLASAQPLIRADDGRYVSLQAYGLLEALYDSPFYWMIGDKAYRNQASAHRGDFTENFVAARLATVFGASNVHRGVTVLRGAKRVTDIDVLVTFADRALVLQCKSKRLTLEARRGNDLQLRDDFKKAVQDAYNQARVSAEALGDTSLRFELADGTELKIAPPRAIYPVCVVSDHYPALTVQAQQFLQFTTDNVIRPPLATDVFMIDVLTEMLESPLKLLSYLDRRLGLADRVMMINEFAILGYHLSNNLWVDPQYSLAMISDDCAIDLDTAMTVRREGIPGRRTPKGFLDRFGATLTGRILTGIERSDNPSLVNLGFMLLTMSSDTLTDLDAGLEQMAAQTRKDGRKHDFTLVFDGMSAGLTVHCSPDPTPDAVQALKRHCERRKYMQRAEGWFGLLIRMSDGMPKAGMELRFPWSTTMRSRLRRRPSQPTPHTIRQGAVSHPSPHARSGGTICVRAAAGQIQEVLPAIMELFRPA